MKKAKFIVIEGCDGSGKSVCIKYLKHKLSDRSDIVFTREPGMTAIGEKVRDILMNKDFQEMLPLTEIFLFCAARAQNVGELIRPTLEAGKHIISDRFDSSTVAYQIFGRERKELMNTFYTLNSIAKAGIEPDCVIYLDVDPVVGLHRIQKSKKGLHTRFDIETIAFHKRVRDGYLFQLAKATKQAHGPQWYLIPTTEAKEQDVQKTVWETVRKILNI